MSLPKLKTCQKIDELCKDLGIDPFEGSRCVWWIPYRKDDTEYYKEEYAGTRSRYKVVCKFRSSETILVPAPTCEELGKFIVLWLLEIGLTKTEKDLRNKQFESFIFNALLSSNETQSRAEAVIIILKGMK